MKTTQSPNPLHPAAWPYLSALYGMEAVAHGQFLQRLLALPATMEAAPPVQQRTDGDGPKKPYAVAGGWAVLPLVGMLQKREDLLSRYFPEEFTAYDTFTRNVTDADADPSIAGLIVYSDSGGGLVDGAAEAADAVYKARMRGKKPVIGIISGACCPCAYWITSQASEVWATSATDPTGSIGIRMRLVDSSKLYEAAGLLPLEITTGTFKAAGADGLPITDEQKAYFQGLVNDTLVSFVGAVARGRKMPVGDVRTLASEARVYIGKQAQDAGLIDGVSTVPEILRRVQRGGTKPATTSGSAASSGKEVAETMNLMEKFEGFLASLKAEAGDSGTPPAAAPPATPAIPADVQAKLDRLTTLESENVTLRTEAEALRTSATETEGRYAELLRAEVNRLAIITGQSALANTVADLPVDALEKMAATLREQSDGKFRNSAAKGASRQSVPPDPNDAAPDLAAVNAEKLEAARAEGRKAYENRTGRRIASAADTRGVSEKG